MLSIHTFTLRKDPRVPCSSAIVHLYAAMLLQRVAGTNPLADSALCFIEKTCALAASILISQAYGYRTCSLGWPERGADSSFSPRFAKPPPGKSLMNRRRSETRESQVDEQDCARSPISPPITLCCSLAFLLYPEILLIRHSIYIAQIDKPENCGPSK
jgi:hypothetical protein